ncbi:capping complex subunit for YIEGIA [Anaeromicrobium sediminis]|uniref:Uncharacterized protein n=1 Tax=Anaeromicrobium sediminis TaxID=1478221 RepID=A0A267MJ71_9FIRM|nr:hypothetical protein [Anaeromicrobium sediminis]PAB58843.1 hypothetical protein CCE28_13190 [Anaeromicrobium sediminis]
MDIGIKDSIVAIVTTDRNSISNYCSVPIFYADTKEQKESLAVNLSKITMSAIHDLENGCFVLIRH